MGQFEEYVNLQRDKKKLDPFYQSMKNKDLDETMYFHANLEGRNEFETKMTHRLTETTFEERTRYYFDDVKLMQNKMLRYYELSGKSGNPEEDTSHKIDAFSGKYDNQKASKRKDAAWDAAVCFDKVVEMQENLKKAMVLTPWQMFEKREAIMRERMKGMLYAAKVKSKSETHEKYLKNKAQISCLTIISDQLENLWARAELGADLKQRKKFLKKQMEIETELQKAREEMRANSLPYLEAQLLHMGYTDERVDQEVEFIQNSHERGSEFATDKNVMLRAILNQADRDTKLKRFPARCVFVNKSGLPLSYTDKRNAEWNQKLGDARNDEDRQTQKDMVLEEIKCMMEYPLPSLEEVRENGVLGLLLKDLHGLYRMIHITAPAICSLADRDGEPVFDDEDLQSQMEEYVATHKVIRAKAGIFALLGDILNKELLNHYHLDLNKEGKYFISRQSYPQGMVDADLHSLEEAYRILDEVSFSSEDNVSFHGEQEEEEEEDVNIISTSSKPKKKKKEKPKIPHELERVRLLKINSNLTDEMHLWYRNINGTMDEAASEKKYLKEALKDLAHFFDEFVFPTDQELANGWFENQLRSGAKPTMTFFRKVKVLSSNAEKNQALAAYEREHPEFAAKRLAATNLADMFRHYFKLEYCIDMGENMDRCEMTAPLSKELLQTEEDRTVAFGKRYLLWRRNMMEGEASKSGAGENAQPEIADHAVNQNGYNQEYYKAFSNSNKVLYHPLFRARLRNGHTKSITGEGPGYRKPAGVNLRGAVGAMLRSVEYGENWKPKNGEEVEKHQWNDRWTRAWEEGDGETITEMSMSGLRSLFVLELPSRDDLVINDWVGENLRHQPGKLFEMIRRIQALPMLVREVPPLHRYCRTHPKLARKINAAIGLCKYVNAYINGVKKAGFDLDPRSDSYGKPDPAVIQKMGQKYRIKVHPHIKAHYEFVQDDYLDLYDKYLDTEPEGVMRGSGMKVTGEPEQKLINLDESEQSLDDLDAQEKKMLDDLAVLDKNMPEGLDTQEKKIPDDLEELKEELVDEEKFGMDLSMIKEDGEIIENEENPNQIHEMSEDDESISLSQEIIKKEKNTSLISEISEEKEENGSLMQDIEEKEENLNRIVEHKESEKTGTDDKVVNHERRERHLHQEQLKQQKLFKKVYEKQAYNSNDCWSCAGTALINAYMMPYTKYVWQSQQNMRGFSPEFLSKEEMGLNRRAWDRQTFEIQEFTMGNRSADRELSPMGNPFLIADYYLKLLEKSPAHKNTAVRKATFQTEKAMRHKEGLTIDGQYMGKDSAAVHNLREHFMDIVAGAIHKQEALVMYYHGHYYFITGIAGEKLEVCDSKDGPDAVEMLDVKDVIGKGDPQGRPVELVWLDKIEDPKALQKEFRGLGYDEDTGAFSTQQPREVRNIAHKMGIDVVKDAEDVPKDVSSYVSESIYLPKTFAPGAQKETGGNHGNAQ